MFLPSFHAQYGFRHKYCAVDLLHSCNAVLEAVTSCNDVSVYRKISDCQKADRVVYLWRVRRTSFVF